MRILILFTILIGVVQAADCPDIGKDFSSYYGTTKEDPLLSINASVSGDHQDKIICAAESCGSAGCQCALYVPIDNCMHRVLEFRGSHKILGEKKDGMSAIQVRHKGDALSSELKKVYVWDKDRRHYVEDGK